MSDTFCVLPWIHLSTQPAGNVVLCCEADHGRMISASHDRQDEQVTDGYPYFYNLDKDSIIDTLNSKSFCNVRKQMLAGEKPTACQNCFKKEAEGTVSKRQRENKNFSDFTLAHASSITDQNGWIAPQLRFVELRLGNACNLRCVTCNPSSSSQWRDDWVKLQSLDFVKNRYKLDDQGNWIHTKYIEYRWAESTSFWTDFLKYADQLELIYINGGEPLLNKQHARFLKKLVELGLAKGIVLQYTINLTLLSEDIVALWKHFKKVKVGCSIDDIKERNDYIRFPSKWDQVVGNYYALKSHTWIETTVVQTVSAYNYLYLDSLYRMLDDGHTFIYYNFVKDPDYMSPNVLPKEIRCNVNARYKNALPRYVVDQLEASYSGEQDVVGLEKFKEVTAKLDTIRGVSFCQVFPELAKVI